MKYIIWFMYANKEEVFNNYQECLKAIKKYESEGYEHSNTDELDDGYRFVMK